MMRCEERREEEYEGKGMVGRGEIRRVGKERIKEKYE